MDDQFILVFVQLLTPPQAWLVGSRDTQTYRELAPLVGSQCHGHDNTHVMIQTLELLYHNKLLCFNQHIQYMVMLS